MLKTTTWKPDTCGCVIEYEWDDAVSENVRTHKVKNIIKNCGLHGKTLEEEVYNSVLDENQRKNKMLGAIIDKIPSATENRIQEDGSFIKQLKAGLQYNWKFNADRNLEVNLVGFSAANKSAIKVLANSLFGTKIKIM